MGKSGRVVSVMTHEFEFWNRLLYCVIAIAALIFGWRHLNPLGKLCIVLLCSTINLVFFSWWRGWIPQDSLLLLFPSMHSVVLLILVFVSFERHHMSSLSDAILRFSNDKTAKVSGVLEEKDT